MMKRFAFGCATLATLGACSETPEPQPDPALVERIALANTVDPAIPKLEKADRIVAAVDRSEPDRLAGAAERLLARWPPHRNRGESRDLRPKTHSSSPRGPGFRRDDGKGSERPLAHHVAGGAVAADQDLLLRPGGEGAADPVALAPHQLRVMAHVGIVAGRAVVGEA